MNISQFPEKSNYSNNVTNIMDSNSNILLKSSSFIRTMLRDSIKENRFFSNNKNKSLKQNKILKKIKNLNVVKKKIISLSPTFNDREKLTTFYKTTLNNKNMEKKNIENEYEKKSIFQRYKINTKNLTKNLHLPKIEDKDLTYIIREKYFKNLDSANKIIQTNKQINLRINEMGKYFQLEKYNDKINQNESTKLLIKKMPKIKIKLIKSDDEEIVDNIKFLNKSNEIIFKTENLSEKNKESKKRRISINLFRRISYNGILTSNSLKNGKKSKKEIHHVNALISLIKLAYRPNALSQFSISIYNNKLYLFGGLSVGFNNQLWKYDISLRKWNKIQINIYEEPVPRYAHTSILINNNIIIFGGEVPKNYFKFPEELIIFNIDKNKFIFPKIKNNHIQQRKGHICVATTETMLIHGGMDIETLKIENSSYIFNVNKMKWSPFDYIGEKLPTIMYHNAVIVNNFFNLIDDSYSFYKPPNNIPSNRINKIKFEGIYLFGGINEERIISNEIIIISICKKPCEVFKPKINGIPPRPRYNSKMIFISDYNFIVISGGTGINQFVFNDLMILDMECLNWIKPIFDNDNPQSPKYLIHRTEHEMFYNNGKIYLFGGRDENNYVKMDFECIEFEITNF